MLRFWTCNNKIVSIKNEFVQSLCVHSALTWCMMSSVSGVWRCHSVLWDVPARVSDWSAALPVGSPEPRSSQTFLLQRRGVSVQQHHNPTLSLHQQVYLSALSLAVLWCFPQVPHIPLSLLHLRPSCPGHREVSSWFYFWILPLNTQLSSCSLLILHM